MSVFPSQKYLTKKLEMSAFENAGQDVGLQIWRIEDFEAVPYEDNIGKFHVGDSYIVLKVMK